MPSAVGALCESGDEWWGGRHRPCHLPTAAASRRWDQEPWAGWGPHPRDLDGTTMAEVAVVTLFDDFVVVAAGAANAVSLLQIPTERKKKKKIWSLPSLCRAVVRRIPVADTSIIFH